MRFSKPRLRPALSEERRGRYGLDRAFEEDPLPVMDYPEIEQRVQGETPPASQPTARRKSKTGASKSKASAARAGKKGGRTTAAVGAAVAPAPLAQTARRRRAPAVQDAPFPASPSIGEQDSYDRLRHTLRPEESPRPEQPFIVRPPILAAIILVLAVVGGLGVYVSADALFGSGSDSGRTTGEEAVLSAPTPVPSPVATVSPASIAEPPATSEPAANEPAANEPVPDAPATPAPAPVDPLPVGGGYLAYVDVSGGLRAGGGSPADALITDGAQHPAWSPDGSRLAFVKQVDARYELWTWDVATATATTVLGPVSELIRGPVWQADGKALLYHEQPGGNETGRVMRVTVPADAPPEVVLDSSALSLNQEGYAAIVHAFDSTPDGRIVFQGSVARPGAVYADACAIFVTNQGGGVSEVTSLQSGVCHGLPSVSPDGRRVAFVSYPGDGAGYIAIAELESGAYHQLHVVRLRGVATNPFWPRIAWSADSQRVYYESVEGGDVIFAQDANDLTSAAQIWGYGRHPALP